MSVSSGCEPGAAPAWWPVPGLGCTELVEGPTLPLSPPRLLYCHMPAEDGAAEVYEGRERLVELRGVYEGADGEREGLMLLG